MVTVWCAVFLPLSIRRRRLPDCWSPGAPSEAPLRPLQCSMAMAFVVEAAASRWALRKRRRSTIAERICYALWGVTLSTVECRLLYFYYTCTDDFSVIKHCCKKVQTLRGCSICVRTVLSTLLHNSRIRTWPPNVSTDRPVAVLVLYSKGCSIAHAVPFNFESYWISYASKYD